MADRNRRSHDRPFPFVEEPDSGISIRPNRRRPRLTAQWHTVEGELVCRWVAAD
jgi:hypothetical protein